MTTSGNQVLFEVFQGSWESWEQLFARAAAFATEIGPERLISIAHSEDANDGVVTVWYWRDAPNKAVYA